ncbi:MAG: PQQ-dependent sugar dehydrogenase [Planctomycetes bacterium]|jgi:glucose/arabinose dehydrogenase|nr:PQQ-dependent sugar dehydrogenase [Planctomycetota bacterium]
MLRPLAALAAATLFVATTATAQNVPTGFVIDTLISSGLQAPNDFCFLPDGRVLLANRAGLVQIHAGGAPVSVGSVPNVQTSSEQGLLSIAADPNFPTNGYLYVWYASSLDAFLHLDRFTCTGDLANPASTNLTFAASSRRVILGAMPDTAFNHNGGSTRFGPDGMLYQSMGDDAVSCNAQSLTSSAGCVLRMDVSGLPAGGSTTLPALSSLDPGNNPLSANNTDMSQLLVAHGLRNPFRMEIDQLTGNLYIGDVGQNAVEEYDEYVYSTPLVLRNFGWPWREANNSYTTCSGSLPAWTPPIGFQAQGGGWQSVMGGPRYRNQGGQFDFGAAYEGNAFFLDYFSGELRRLVNTGTWAIAPAVAGQPSPTNWGTGFVAVCSMRQGPDGGMWFMQHSGTYGTSGGSLKRIRLLGPTNSVASVSGSGQVGVALEAFPTPLVARVFDTGNNPLPGGTVNFTVSGPATLSTTNPVIADANGFVTTNVTATNGGGTITVTATTPNSQTNGTFSLFSRKTTVAGTGSLVVVSLSNTTTAVPAQVPFIILVSLPGAPVWNSPFGTVCTDPSSYLTIVIEDATGIFGGVSLSGSGSTGNPSLTKIFNVAPGLLTGLNLKFQAIGFDPITGIFRTSCESKQF